MGIGRIGSDKGRMNEPNVVPFIDILLVLIIIFMVITPLVPKGLDALVPHQDKRTVEDRDVGVIVIQMDCADSQCMQVDLKINQEPVTWDTIGAKLGTIFKERAEPVAFIKASENLEFADVARAIDIAKGAGVEQVGLMTSNP